MLNSELHKETIRQNDERYLKMIDEIKDYAIILLDKNGFILNWNQGAEQIKGYTSAEAIGKSFRIFYSDNDKADGLPDRLLEEARKNGRATHEGWRTKKDGSTFWASVVLTALHDDNNNVVGFSKVTRDLTERKLAEDQQQEYARLLERTNEILRRSEERYHKMVNEVQDYAILLLDLEGKIQNWNYGAEKIKGYTSAEILGKSFTIFYTPEDVESGLPNRLLQEAAREGRAVHEGWRIRKDGGKFWGSTVLTALHDDNNNIIGYSKVTRDLTDKKAAEDRMDEYARQLEQKNQELEEFAYIASHDLKEPLRKIVAFGQLLQHSYKDNTNEKANDYITRMQDASRRMMSLIDNLLQYSRLGKNEEPFELTNLNQVIERVLQDLEPSIQAKKASISVDKLPSIMGRPLQLQQLFQNLVSNSLKFNNKETPIVNIRHTTVNNHAHRLTVEDNGIGFEEEDAARIFEAFYRLHGRSEYTGSGIGLAICKKIVQLHNGTISAQGEKDRGASFIIELPTTQP